MESKNMENIYDKLFDYRKINQIKLSQQNSQVFYDNFMSNLIINNVNNSKILNDSVLVFDKRNNTLFNQNTIPIGIVQEDNNTYPNELISSSTNSNFSNKSNDTSSYKFSLVRSKISKKSRVNRSKSLVLKKNRNINFIKQNYIEFNNSNSIDVYNKITECLNKPKIYPRSVYLTYERTSNSLNYQDNFNEFQDNKADMNIPDNNLNTSTGSNRSSGKNQLRSFINRKILNRSDNNHEENGFDDSRLTAFRNRILTDFINPIKKSISSASSKSSSFSSSLSCSSSSSSPPSPMNISRKFKVINQNDQSSTSKDYESIYDDEIERKVIAKGKVVDELIQTEMDFYRVMKLMFDIYLGPNSDSKISTDIKDSIFCNIKDLVQLSSVLLNDFESNILNQNQDQVRIGKCFLKNCETIRINYSYYAQYIEYSNNILDKNEKSPELIRYIENGLNIIKQQVNTLDLQSLLLKPIQRVLKYPLLLQELIKNTESCHEDYQDLLEALKSMQNVATYINEIKRRHELIVKYGRRIKENSTITNKMSKLTMHSMIKKSNRISVKLSNALKINAVTTVDEKFDEWEIKFHSMEKIIKNFIKDVVGLLSSLKELLKSQTANSESLQEYFGDDKFEEIVHYVQLNSHFLNDFITKKTSLIHEKVMKPLKDLLECLETPNKLIIKRNDKLLDYEFAKLNIERSKDKLTYKTNQENLVESKKNFEALNNQLIEELPHLVLKCSIIFDKCFQIFALLKRNIYQTTNFEIQNLINKHKNGNVFLNENPSSSSYTSLTTQLNNKFLNNNKNNNSFQNQNCDYSEIGNSNRNQSNSSSTGLDKMQRFFSSKPEQAKKIKNLFNLQIFKNLSNQEKPDTSKNYNSKQPHLPSGYNSSYDLIQTDEIRDRLKRLYENNLFIVLEKFSGFGLSDNLNLEINDIVFVLKQSDPCGNTDSWFVDNGISKGIVPSRILKPYVNRKVSVNLIDFNAESNYNQADDTFTEPFSSDLVNNNQNNAYNFDNNSNANEDEDSFTSDESKVEFCVALYAFEALNESTLTISEGERFKIIDKHDSNYNNEWWFVERIDDFELGRQGYVPANYVELVKY
ncbi:unnamed protein product [Brachionus calyciflorus]|uniref:Dynamin-binding protein n=1 Tax=Brachionus calyciflorus TaxID=104777 RepID=A0A813V9U8_9BILA|nr:unnamed protein product [Brachionus calyciflorus]